MTLLRRSLISAPRRLHFGCWSVRRVVATRRKICSRDNYIEPRVSRADDFASSAGYTHVARYSRDTMGPVNNEIMALRFVCDCLADRHLEEFVPL